jgi:hypothetical protein
LAKAEIDALSIIKATFENTIVAMDYTGGSFF